VQLLFVKLSREVESGFEYFVCQFILFDIVIPNTLWVWNGNLMGLHLEINKETQVNTILKGYKNSYE
jgi:hypothetical protein